ncbi:hypothetical protein [Roseomonas sp. KE0001]|uniref:hypothetical protein n=1 Tax=Roseomonas sp. KE0001 TaxID=2479201 RepID=UPI0018DF6424|nr:hypothetical protein [Roseomonas sp. KE0001]
MQNDDSIRVTVAPGARVRLHPHPSGWTGLSDLLLDAGESLQVTRAEAALLYERRQILHPDTGAVKPVLPTPDGATISIGGRPAVPLSANGVWGMQLASDERRLLNEHAERKALEAKTLREADPHIRPRVTIEEQLLLAPLQFRDTDI